MEYLNIFSTFLAVENLTLDNDAIIEFCYRKFSTEKNRIAEQQSWIMPEDLTGEIKKLFDQVAGKFNEAHKRLGFNDTYHQEIQEAWCTINNCYATSKPHTHPTSFFSAVYYPKGQIGCGTIEFLTPNTAAQHSYYSKLIADYNEFTSSTFVIEPRPGTLIIFPSWLIHYVNENTNNEDRISIALNSHPIENNV
jgi:uncharacterized protein (TIGR02466 family)